MQKVFCSCLREKWIDLHQTKTEMINGPFNIAKYISPAKTHNFPIFSCFVKIGFLV